MPMCLMMISHFCAQNFLLIFFCSAAQGDTLTIKAWNLRPSLVWKDGRWIECSSSGENVSSSHEVLSPFCGSLEASPLDALAIL